MQTMFSSAFQCVFDNELHFSDISLEQVMVKLLVKKDGLTDG